VQVFAVVQASYIQHILTVIILNLTLLMQVVLSATLSCLYLVLEDFHMSTDNLVQNVLLVSAIIPLGTKLAYNFKLTEWL